MDIKELDKKYVANTYARFPIELVSGKGSKLYDSDGKEYIDMGTGIGVSAFGVGDEKWVDAVTKQLTTLQHTSNLYYTAPCARLAELLCEKTGAGKVFFSNSGAEANECAIKAARKYAAEKKGEDFYKIIGYKFTRIILLKKALTHSSFSKVKLDNNERLEFLGDAVLKLIVSNYGAEWINLVSSNASDGLFSENASFIEGF